MGRLPPFGIEVAVASVLGKSGVLVEVAVVEYLDCVAHAGSDLLAEQIYPRGFCPVAPRGSQNKIEK